MANVQFGWEANKFSNTHVEEDSGISVEDWATMTDDQKQDAVNDWLFDGGQINVWTSPE